MGGTDVLEKSVVNTLSYMQFSSCLIPIGKNTIGIDCSLYSPYRYKRYFTKGKNTWHKLLIGAKFEVKR